MTGRLCIVAAIVVVQVGAQDQRTDRDTLYAVDPVVVTATTAIERLSPVTFSNLNRAQIRSRYSGQDVPVLLAELPSITTYSENGSGIGYNYINLRGFDQRRISVMVNGVPQNDPEDHNVYWIDFPDLLASTQSIQVQRGAGTAFYGPAAIGGSVNMSANPFEAKPGISIESQFGFQELGNEGRTPLATRRLSLSVNSGVVGGSYMFFGRVGRILHDGYRENGWVDLSSYFLGALRIDPAMTTRIHVYGGPFSDGLAYVGLPTAYNADLQLRRRNYSYWEYDSTGRSVGYSVLQKPQARESFSQPHYEVINDWTLSDRASLHTSVFYIQGDGYFDYDGDWVPYDPSASAWFRTFVGYDSTFGPASSTFYSFLIRGSVKNRQWGILPRIEVGHEGGTLTVGAEVRVHRSLHQGFLAFASQYPSPLFTEDTPIYEYRGVRDIVSLYAHEVYRARDDISLLLDLQAVYNRYGVRDERFLGNAFDVRYWFVNPRAGVNLNISDAWHAYAFAGLTTREPTLRNLYAAEDAYFGATPQFEADTSGGGVRYDFSRPLAKPERLINVEVGAGWSTTGARLAASAFWMEFENELVKSGRVDIFGQPVTGNAKRSRHVGVELEGVWRSVAGVSLSGNVTWSNDRLVRFTSYESGTAASLDGNPIAGFPDLLANLRLSFERGGFTGAVAARHVGAFYTDNTRNAARRNEAFTVINVESSYAFELPGRVGLTVRGEVRNLFDLLYTMSGEGDAFFPAAERNYVVGVGVTL